MHWAEAGWEGECGEHMFVPLCSKEKSGKQKTKTTDINQGLGRQHMTAG